MSKKSIVAIIASLIVAAALIAVVCVFAFSPTKQAPSEEPKSSDIVDDKDKTTDPDVNPDPDPEPEIYRLDKPTNLIIDQSEKQLTWDSVEDADHYVVYVQYQEVVQDGEEQKFEEKTEFFEVKEASFDLSVIKQDVVTLRVVAKGQDQFHLDSQPSLDRKYVAFIDQEKVKVVEQLVQQMFNSRDIELPEDTQQEISESIYVSGLNEEDISTVVWVAGNFVEVVQEFDASTALQAVTNVLGSAYAISQIDNSSYSIIASLLQLLSSYFKNVSENEQYAQAADYLEDLSNRQIEELSSFVNFYQSALDAYAKLMEVTEEMSDEIEDPLAYMLGDDYRDDIETIKTLVINAIADAFPSVDEFNRVLDTLEGFYNSLVNEYFKEEVTFEPFKIALVGLYSAVEVLIKSINMYTLQETMQMLDDIQELLTWVDIEDLIIDISTSMNNLPDEMGELIEMFLDGSAEIATDLGINVDNVSELLGLIGEQDIEYIYAFFNTDEYITFDPEASAFELLDVLIGLLPEEIIEEEDRADFVSEFIEELNLGEAFKIEEYLASDDFKEASYRLSIGEDIVTVLKETNFIQYLDFDLFMENLASEFILKFPNVYDFINDMLMVQTPFYPDEIARIEAEEGGLSDVNFMMVSEDENERPLSALGVLRKYGFEAEIMVDYEGLMQYAMEKLGLNGLTLDQVKEALIPLLNELFDKFELDIPMFERVMQVLMIGKHYAQNDLPFVDQLIEFTDFEDSFSYAALEDYIQIYFNGVIRYFLDLAPSYSDTLVENPGQLIVELYKLAIYFAFGDYADDFNRLIMDGYNFVITFISQIDNLEEEADIYKELTNFLAMIDLEALASAFGNPEEMKTIVDGLCDQLMKCNMVYMAYKDVLPKAEYGLFIEDYHNFINYLKAIEMNEDIIEKIEDFFDIAPTYIDLGVVAALGYVYSMLDQLAILHQDFFAVYYPTISFIEDVFNYYDEIRPQFDEADSDNDIDFIIAFELYLLNSKESFLALLDEDKIGNLYSDFFAAAGMLFINIDYTPSEFNEDWEYIVNKIDENYAELVSFDNPSIPSQYYGIRQFISHFPTAIIDTIDDVQDIYQHLIYGFAAMNLTEDEALAHFNELADLFAISIPEDLDEVINAMSYLYPMAVAFADIFDDMEMDTEDLLDLAICYCDNLKGKFLDEPLTGKDLNDIYYLLLHFPRNLIIGDEDEIREMAEVMRNFEIRRNAEDEQFVADSVEKIMENFNKIREALFALDIFE